MFSRAGCLICLLIAVAAIPSLPGGQQPPAASGSQPPGEIQSGPGYSPLMVASNQLPPIRLSPSAKPANTRLLKHLLYPDSLELTPGNAATVWMRAGRAAASTRPKSIEEENKWLSAADTPLKQLPRDQVRDFLARYDRTLRLADEAARKNRCDWELPPLLTQNLGTYSFDEVQSCREIANLLSLQSRLEMSEGKLDQALHTLQTGFALARHASQGDSLIQSIVGIAIAQVMLNRVEEFIQLPDAPNLYWALATLPNPFVDIRTALDTELNAVYRSFPLLRQLESLETTPADFDRLGNDLTMEFAKLSGGSAADRMQMRLVVIAAVLKTYPPAKEWLIAQGQTEKRVEEMPALQAVLAYQLQQYNELRDEILAGTSLPPWQAVPALRQVDRKIFRLHAEGNINPFLLLVPAATKVQESCVSLQRNIAILRAAESLRGYAGAHDGKVPDQWSENSEVPTVIDPLTGRSFDDGYYQVMDATAILAIPPGKNLPFPLNRRFELKAAR